MNPTRSARTSRRFSSLVACGGGAAAADWDEEEDIDEADDAVAPADMVGCDGVVGCDGMLGCDGMDGWEIGRGGPLLSIRKLAPFSRLLCA